MNDIVTACYIVIVTMWDTPEDEWTVFVSNPMEIENAKEFARSSGYHDDFWKDRPMHLGWKLNARVFKLGEAPASKAIYSVTVGVRRTAHYADEGDVTLAEKSHHF